MESVVHFRLETLQLCKAHPGFAFGPALPRLIGQPGLRQQPGLALSESESYIQSTNTT